MNNKDIENLVYLSQIDSRDIFVYAQDAVGLLEWLNDNGHAVQSWEAFLETKKEIVRTVSFGDKVDSPYRSVSQDISKIKNDIEFAIDDWSKSSKDSHLIICLNLKDELKPKINIISKSTRIVAGTLGFCCLGVLGVLLIAIINGNSLENMEWIGPVSALICAPIFLYAAFTGKGDLSFISPENYFKKIRKRKIKTETGQLRWPQNAYRDRDAHR